MGDDDEYSWLVLQAAFWLGKNQEVIKDRPEMQVSFSSVIKLFPLDMGY